MDKHWNYVACDASTSTDTWPQLVAERYVRMLVLAPN